MSLINNAPTKPKLHRNVESQSEGIKRFNLATIATIFKAGTSNLKTKIRTLRFSEFE